MFDMKAKACEVNERGYCVLEAVYDEDECQQMRKILDRMCERQRGLSLDAPRFSFHPFLQLCPEMGPFFGKDVAVEAMAEILQDDVRLAHSGASVTNEHANPRLTDWHAHYAWDVPPNGLNRDNPERVLCNIYVDGSTPEVGPLIVLPRRLNDSITPPCDDIHMDWPGQVEINIPPGSALIFDTAVWHASKRGSQPGHRHLWGGHYQGWHNTKRHREDNNSDSPALARYKRELPMLRGLVNCP